jgi:simple sugar transport system ATP-binding protein
VFVTHNPHHAYPVGDRFVVLRRGQVLGDLLKRDLSPARLVEMMSGGGHDD